MKTTASSSSSNNHRSSTANKSSSSAAKSKHLKLSKPKDKRKTTKQKKKKKKKKKDEEGRTNNNGACVTPKSSTPKYDHKVGDDPTLTPKTATPNSTSTAGSKRDLSSRPSSNPSSSSSKSYKKTKLVNTKAPLPSLSFESLTVSSGSNKSGTTKKPKSLPKKKNGDKKLTREGVLAIDWTARNGLVKALLGAGFRYDDVKDFPLSSLHLEVATEWKLGPTSLNRVITELSNKLGVPENDIQVRTKKDLCLNMIGTLINKLSNKSANLNGNE